MNYILHTCVNFYIDLESFYGSYGEHAFDLLIIRDGHGTLSPIFSGSGVSPVSSTMENFESGKTSPTDCSSVIAQPKDIKGFQYGPV